MELANSARINSAIQVVQRTFDGMSVSAACREVGIPRSTIYDVCNRNPEMLAKIQVVIEVHAYNSLDLYSRTKQRYCRKSLMTGFQMTQNHEIDWLFTRH